MLTQTRLRELLNYDPVTGEFQHRFSKGGFGRPERLAGVLTVQGYRIIGVDGERLRAARLAWLYMTGEWPKHFVDHINNDPADDRWCNLREASQSENMANGSDRVDNTSGYRGVTWDKERNKWVAQVQFKGKNHFCGRYSTKEEAAVARDAKAQILHGAFARLNSLTEYTA
jgi:hypothetical protein